MPPERDKALTFNPKLTTTESSIIIEHNPEKAQKENVTDSQIQMNSSTKHAVEKLKDKIQGKLADEKRETSLGKRNRELREKFSALVEQNKKNRKILEAAKNGR